MKIKEIQIPVPWGVVAAKCWGDELNASVIVLHGFQDNAGSFDRLIPILPDVYHYVCLDLPSHGRSTHIPAAIFVTFLDFVTALKLVLDHLNKKKYILMGHSFGAQTAILFTQIFPQYILKLIMLDTMYYLPITPDKVVPEFEFDIRMYCKHLKNDDSCAPTYTREEAVQRLVDTRFVPISKENAAIIMERSLIPTENGRYKISSAQHLKYILRAPLTVQYDLQLLKHFPVKCPHLIVMAEDSLIHKYMTRPWKKAFEKNRHFLFRVVKGDHDVHLEHPERVAGIISKFLLKQFHNKL